MLNLHVDVETYSPIDLKKSGLYAYCKHPDFEILTIAYGLADTPIKVIDYADIQNNGEPLQVLKCLLNKEDVKKLAFNAAFERQVFKRLMGYYVPWTCTMIKAAYCGLPLSLQQCSEVLLRKEDRKDKFGTRLINYFSKPCKPTTANGQRTRNLPEHHPEYWEAFKNYCVQDVHAEREIHKKLEAYQLPDKEKQLYRLDQKINDHGVKIDVPFVLSAIRVDREHSERVVSEIRSLTGVENPNSLQQIKNWIFQQTGQTVKSITKETVKDLIQSTKNETVKEVLRLRTLLAKSSIKKYDTMLNTLTLDGNGHGYFQFYGANRTGRWAGRLVQLQNLVRNKLDKKGMTLAKEAVKTKNIELLQVCYKSVPGVLSQLVRGAFIAGEGKTFAISDFSAIEARVISWLAGEKWRLDVFKGHGKIYEASAANMYGVDIEAVTGEMRQKGKIAELALGYGGSVGALTQMGGEAMGLSPDEMQDIVDLWRKSNPKIVKLWRLYETACKKAIMKRGQGFKVGFVTFRCDADYLFIDLPSGRSLFYYQPALKQNHFTEIMYAGLNQTSRKWERVTTWGGKLAENITQAIARDVLAESMLSIDSEGFDIVLHVHDEIAVKTDKQKGLETLHKIIKIMSVSPNWASGLPLGANGFISDFYLKD